MNTCLYCTSEPNSIEHPLPAAFGEFEGAPMLEDRICGGCNTERLGLLDEQLTRSGPEAILRKFFGVKGRSRNEKVNPYYRGSAGGKRLKMRAFDSSLGEEIELEQLEGYEARQLCQLIVTEDSGSKHYLPLSEKLRTPEALREAIEKLAIKTLATATVRLICDAQEREWLEPLILTLWPKASFGEPVLGAKTFEKAVIEMQCTDRYFRAIAKIGFHYFLTQFPQFHGSEPCFAEIRGYITTEGQPLLIANDFILRRETPLLGEMNGGARPVGWFGHVLTAEIRRGVCLAHLHLFVSAEYRGPVYTVLLGDSGTGAEGSVGHLYVYFTDDRPGRFSGRVESLTTR
jgi:hypothetical protein